MSNMMEKKQAARFLSGLCNDYVETLRSEGKETTADIVAANANASIRALSSGESSKAVPETQGEGDGGDQD